MNSFGDDLSSFSPFRVASDDKFEFKLLLQKAKSGKNFSGLAKRTWHARAFHTQSRVGNVQL